MIENSKMDLIPRDYQAEQIKKNVQAWNHNMTKFPKLSDQKANWQGIKVDKRSKKQL